MTTESHPSQSTVWFRPLALLTVACVIAGILARFWGLGRWPLAIDEYYFAQSVQNLLHNGLPAFPCGGFYVRGVLLQYASAALQFVGLSAELAPRLIAAISSVLTLPPAYWIARRLGGREIGLLAVAVLALSVWEVEIGRFGRMYAPFQALFAWYVVFFVRYVIDHDRRALVPMLVLSVLGFTVWEGGIFLVLTNLLPPFIAHPDGRLSRRDWLYLGSCCLLLLPAYFLTMADLRAVGDPALPADYADVPDTPSQSRLDAAVMPVQTLPGHPGWVVLALLPGALVLYAALQQLQQLFGVQARPLAVLSTLAILLLAALHQFQLALGVVVVGILLGILDGRALVSREARPLHVALLACMVFWTAFGLLTHDWHGTGMSFPHKVFLLGYEFVRVPDTVRQVAMPWARTVPLLALGLATLVAAMCVRACLNFAATSPLERVLLALFVILLLAASASNPPRHETRYVFFLYPFAVIFSLLTIQRAVQTLLGSNPRAAGVAILACIAAFACSEDFRPWHLWNIDSEAVNFRIGMPGRLAGHYHPRTDLRSAAVWLQAHAQPGRDLVINSYPGVDFYYRQSDFYFIPETDPRFEAYSCRRGTVQRWSNLPMIYSYDALLAKAAGGRRIWMVLERSRMPEVLAKFPPGAWTLEWTSRARDIAIVAVQEPQNHGSG